MILSTFEDVTKIIDHDVLTGEYNRNGFIRYVSEILEHCADRKKYAILFFNIKGFKAMNELVGVSGGDRILRDTMEVFQKSFLQPVAISRYEADHFVLFVEREKMNLDRLGELCHRTFEMNGKSFRLYARCGIYLLKDKVYDVSGMCDRAKMAKNYITDDYVKPYAIYDDNMKAVFIKQKELLSDLDQGVKNEEFVVYYQPVYDVITGKIASAEALVRWKHPRYGIVPPGEFISIFEENGYISQLDSLVEDATKDLVIGRAKQKKHIVPIAINLSRMDFYDDSFMSKIIHDVNEIRELDEYCRLEITESAYSVLIDHAANYIREFKEAGVKILLDDFGSGYSSFSTITEFDFDIIKLDIGFIRQIGVGKKVECIIRNIIRMAHELHLEVIAEGVETQEQKAFLMENECDYIQGYLYSKPLPKEEFIRLLDQE